MNQFSLKHVTAAVELAGGATQAEAAAKSGVAERTIRRWLDRAEFKALVGQCREEIAAHVRASGTERGLRRAEERIAALEGLFQRLSELVESRAEAAKKDAMAPPGADTGLLTVSPVRHFVRRARGEYRWGEFDSAVVAQIRAIVLAAHEILGHESGSADKFEIVLRPRE